MPVGMCIFPGCAAARCLFSGFASGSVPISQFSVAMGVSGRSLMLWEC